MFLDLEAPSMVMLLTFSWVYLVSNNKNGICQAELKKF